MLIVKIVSFVFTIMIIVELGLFIVLNIVRMFKVTPSQTPMKFWAKLSEPKGKYL